MNSQIVLLFGGASEEYDVSLASAASVLRALDSHRWSVCPIGISKEGRWYLSPADPDRIESDGWLDQTARAGEVIPAPGGFLGRDGRGILPAAVLPVMHGRIGEDGRVQGLFDTLSIPYVGCGCAASAVAMDKALTKALAASLDVPTVPYLTVCRGELTEPHLTERITDTLGLPLFVKPCTSGSSLGASEVHTAEELFPALASALCHSDTALVERLVRARECEVALLDTPSLSLCHVGEVETGGRFYDYRTKYECPSVGLSTNPALPCGVADRMQDYAWRVFRALGGRHLARLDFFYDEHDGQIYLSEINTMPGMTAHSLYPRLMEAEGLSFSRLLTLLLEAAL